MTRGYMEVPIPEPETVLLVISNGERYATCPITREAITHPALVEHVLSAMDALVDEVPGPIDVGELPKW